MPIHPHAPGVTDAHSFGAARSCSCQGSRGSRCCKATVTKVRMLQFSGHRGETALAGSASPSRRSTAVVECSLMPSSYRTKSSPIEQRPIQLPVNRQIRALIWIRRRQLFVDLYPKTRSVARIHVAFFKSVTMREYRIGLRSVRHVLLNAKVVDRQAKMERCRHTHGRKIRRAMTARANMKQRRKIRDLFQRSKAAGMRHRHPDIVNPLLANQLLCVPDRIENFSRGDRSRCMLTDNLK